MTKQEYNQRYYLKNRDKALAEAAAYRQANRKVIAEKAIVAYYRTRGHVLAQKREYAQRTKPQRARYNKQYRAANLAPLKARAKKHRQEHREQIRARQRAYWLQNKDKHAAWMRTYRQRHPERHKAGEHRRRALERNARTDFAGVREFFSWIKNQDFVTCTYCGVYISGRAVSIDHIVPLSRGGAHEPGNFCVSCRSCNSSKHDQLLTEWKRCPERIRAIANFVETSHN